MMTWLNLGSGSHPAPPPWINVDRHPDPGVDVVASVTALPFGDATVERVYAGHILEHLGYDSGLPAALAEVRRVLKPTGALAVVGPCYYRALATYQPDWLLRAIEADPDDGSGRGHRWTPTTDLTRAALWAAGFASAEVDVERMAPPRWPNPSTAPWQCAFLCVP